MDGSVGSVSRSVNPSLSLRANPIAKEIDERQTNSPNTVAQGQHVDGTEEKERTLKAVEVANSVAEIFDKKLSFNYDERINQVIVKVIRESTHEVIRQIPPEEMVELMAKLHDDVRGLILNHTG